jgi:hypothetical protein
MNFRALLTFPLLAIAYPASGGTYSVTFNESLSVPKMIYNLPPSGNDEIDVTLSQCIAAGTESECSGALYSDSAFSYFAGFEGYDDRVTGFAIDSADWIWEGGSYIAFYFYTYAPNTTACPYAPGNCEVRPTGSQFLFISGTNFSGDTLNVYIGTPAPSVPEPSAPVLAFAGLAALAVVQQVRRRKLAIF